MSHPAIKKTSLCCLMSLLPITALAEGIIDIKPNISTSINYSDNVFRLSPLEQANAQSDSSETSDIAKRIDVGVQVNLRLSRQLIGISANINKTDYDRFNNLDNTGKSNSLQWDWKLGSKLYGVLSASENVAIAGFDESRSQERNLTTTKQKFASINWNFTPDWSIKATGQQVGFKNDLVSSRVLDREDNTYGVGVDYANQLGTQLGLAYRIVDSSYPNRTGSVKRILGNESSEKEIILTASWLPTGKTRITTYLAQESLKRKNSRLADFSGLSQRWILDYKPTGKLNLNFMAFKNLSPVDDLEVSYVEAKGINFGSEWNLTSKVLLNASVAYQDRNYLESANFLLNNEDRIDKARVLLLGLVYTPTLKSTVQMQYQGEKRVSNDPNSDYVFNNLNFSFRYDF